MLLDADTRQVSERPVKRWSLWLLAALVIVLVTGLAALQLFVWELIEPENPLDTVAMFSLSSLLFLSFFIFTFILLRNLIKLQRERSRNALGSKLKTRLVTLLISLSLLPITAMSLFSYTFLNRSLEKWFGRLPEDVVAEARAAQTESAQAIERDVRRTAALIASSINANPHLEDYLAITEAARLGASPSTTAYALANPKFALRQATASAEIVAALKDLSTASDSLALELVSPSGERIAAAQQPELREQALSEIEIEGVFASARAQPQTLIKRESIANDARQTASLLAFNQPLAANRGSLIIVRSQMPDAHLANIIAGSENFEQLRDQQRRVRFVGLATLSLLTLLLLVATVWTALYLARGLATPIAALAEAAQEVARGNLKHRVQTVATDELAVLADSFNRMVEQLDENRARLEFSAVELQNKNLALEERRAYIETVLGSLSTGVISLDAENRVTTINDAALAMLHLRNAPHAPNDELSSLIGEEDFATLEGIIVRARRTGRAIEQTELRLRPASETLNVSLNANRETADDEATDSHRYFSPIPVSLMATALHYTPDNASATALPTASSEVSAVENEASAVDANKVSIKSNDAVESDNPVESNDAIELNDSDYARGVVLVIEDLSELLAAQRAAAWSEVARRLAHEIKNPLTPIQLSAERIQRNFRRALDATTLNFASADLLNLERTIEEGTRAIVREVTGLKAMVDEFSAFARLPQPKLAPADLNETIRQTLALYAERFAHIRFNLSLAPGLPNALIDREQMRRVFINLFENAIEAISVLDADDGRITVATAFDARRNLLLIEVTDTGEGILTKDCNRLFQPYFSTRERGTGLGLAIVQRIVTDHGGTIRAEPNRPRGARFHLELPIEEAALRRIAANHNSLPRNTAPSTKPSDTSNETLVAKTTAAKSHEQIENQQLENQQPTNESLYGFLTDPRF